MPRAHASQTGERKGSKSKGTVGKKRHSNPRSRDRNKTLKEAFKKMDTQTLERCANARRRAARIRRELMATALRADAGDGSQ